MGSAVFVYAWAVNQEHVEDCNMVLLDQKNREGANTKIEFQFGRC